MGSVDISEARASRASARTVWESFDSESQAFLPLALRSRPLFPIILSSGLFWPRIEGLAASRRAARKKIDSPYGKGTPAAGDAASSLHEGLRMRTTPGQTEPVNGMEMYYEIHGEGEPLVLLHGFTGSRSYLWIIPNGGRGAIFGDITNRFVETVSAFLRGEWERQ
jgi:hypothetical protein